MQSIIAFIFGTLVGSFLNVCIYRFPKDKSVVKGRSFCPKCNSLIRWFDNIPLLSYTFLGGKCRQCKEKISFRYPLVEFITGLLFFILYVKFLKNGDFSQAYPDFLKYAFFFCLLIVVSFIDIDYHAIPAYLCVIGILIALILGVWESALEFKKGIWDISELTIAKTFKGIFFGLGFTYLFKLFADIFITFYFHIRKIDSIEGEKEALGLGDVDFMGMVGGFLGVIPVVFVFFLAPFFALFYTVFALVFKRSHLLPYLPYLSLATFTVFLWGDKIRQLLGFYF